MLGQAEIDFPDLTIHVLGGLALFLYGMQRMTTALKLVAGDGLKRLLSRLTSNRFSAAAAGAVITAIVQSSSITTVLTVGLIAAGVMTFSQSVGVILGANVGTTVTAQLVAFDISKYGLLLVALGFMGDVFAKRETWKQSGQALMGLGLILFGMELMSLATMELRDYPPFMEWMQGLENPILAIICGCVVTAIVQSSSATTAMVIVLGAQGLLTLETGIAIIFGSNIGTCVTAAFSTLGAPRDAVKAAVVHILFNVLGVCLWLPFVSQFAEVVRYVSNVGETSPDQENLPRMIANAHTLFNVANLLIFIGFTGTLARWADRLVPRPKETESSQATLLDSFFLKQPSTALDNVHRELILMGKQVEGMLEESLQVITVGNEKALQNLRDRDEAIDAHHGEIVKYLGKLSLEELVEPLQTRVTHYLAMANYLEQVGDIVEINLVSDGFKRVQHRLQVSESTVPLLRPLHARVLADMQSLIGGLESGDEIRLKEVALSKPEVQSLADELAHHLAQRLATDEPQRRLTYQFETDITENFKRVHTLLRRVAKTQLTLDEKWPADIQSQHVD